jgi:hypothetical protein
MAWKLMAFSIRICLVLLIGCREGEKISQGSCNKETVLEKAKEIALKKLGKRINDYELRIDEDGSSYTISYSLKHPKDDRLVKGGGIFVIIRKVDCKVIEYMQEK